MNKLSISCEKDMNKICVNFIEILNLHDPYILKSGIVSNINVNVSYGNVLLQNIASIISPDMKTLKIKPYDTNDISKIIFSIEKQNMDVSISSDGTQITIVNNVPSYEKRQIIVKNLQKELEKQKISIRGIRKKYIDISLKLNNNGKIKKEIQDLTDKNIKNIENSLKEKCNFLLGK